MRKLFSTCASRVGGHYTEDQPFLCGKMANSNPLLQLLAGRIIPSHCHPRCDQKLLEGDGNGFEAGVCSQVLTSAFSYAFCKALCFDFGASCMTYRITWCDIPY